ncbi:bifunctional acetate--CoA ligase family protein/GNAT family N-acetyltransferase [Ramlibacter sp. AN1133]|uniref:bifunctional acetate--CoA ligase family protein/GNAT family N-acetyltransferase n=1 Tax=Ramlibacter sp. AN1133 TaxID=3133429 RepID=UPI0030C14B22
MSVRNLESLFAPRSVAIVGVSARPGNLGAIVLRNLRQGGFRGPLWLVDRQEGEVDGLRVHAGVAALPEAPELAVVCTPAETVPGLIEALAARGTRAAIVLSAGLRQPGPDGRPLQQAMLDAARPALLRILGPNCIGVLVPRSRLNASFAPGQALPGAIAFVTQSGALATSMLDWSNAHGIGFSHFVSLGDSADVDFGDVLDYLASDGGTRAILMYMESLKHARKFMSAARAAARNKPVIVVKAGRAPEGARAAASHTGAMAGSDAVFDAAVRRAGMLRVGTLEALFDAAATLAHPPIWQGERLVVLTNGGGAGVLAADALALEGGQLATLGDATLQALDAALPANWSHGNPVDIVGDAPVQRYVDALRTLLAAPEVDGILFMHAPTAVVPAAVIAQACLPLLQGAGKAVLACWLGGNTVDAARRLFADAGFPCHGTPEHTVAAWMQLVHYRRNQQALLQLPDADPAELAVDRASAEALVRETLRLGREWLDEADAKEVLQAYGIPTVPTLRVRDAQEALDAAEELGWPVALKVISPQLQHKSDVGGVALGIASGDELRKAMIGMRQRLAVAAPQAHVTGFTVQKMLHRARSRELIAGIQEDAVFGPVLLFGEGGTAVELHHDSTLELPPLNLKLAQDMVARTRVGRTLGGFRGDAGVNQPAVFDALLRLSRLACDISSIAELDVNPLLADGAGVMALDARIRVRPPDADPSARLALRAYPSALEERVAIDGKPLFVRPIRPEDGRRLAAFYARARPADLRLRFFLAWREMPLSELARYCQIDYEREMTFIALDGDGIVGEVRAVCDPDNVQAEFAVQVDSGWQRHGLGRALLEKMLAWLRERGTREATGVCRRENAGMTALAHALQFDVSALDEETVAMRLRLTAG